MIKKKVVSENAKQNTAASRSFNLLGVWLDIDRA